MAFDRDSELGALWTRQGRSGDFLSGKITIDGVVTELVVFPNSHKKPGEKSPDWRIYKSEPRDGQSPAPQQKPIRTATAAELDDDIPF